MSQEPELALKVYAAAFGYVQNAGLMPEIEWQRSRCFHTFSESDLLREAAWVILCSGFREAIVRKVFNHISLSFCDWESSRAIVATAPACRLAAEAVFRNDQKLKAIVGTAHYINQTGFDGFKQRILKDPIPELQRLPYIGPVTVWHLAKNLGFNAVKPDRHLVRLCDWLAYDDPRSLCSWIAAKTETPIGVVDIVLWRYLTDRPAQARDICLVNQSWTNALIPDHSGSLV